MPLCQLEGAHAALTNKSNLYTTTTCKVGSMCRIDVTIAKGYKKKVLKPVKLSEKSIKQEHYFVFILKGRNYIFGPAHSYRTNKSK